MKTLTNIFLLLIIFTLAAGNPVYSQVLTGADKYYSDFEFSKAIPKYEKMVRKDNNNKEAWAKLGNCYRLTNDTRQAERCYSNVAQGTISINKLYYAQALLSNGKYTEAQKWFEEYHKAEPADIRGEEFLDAMKNREKMIADDGYCKVQRLSINSEDADYGAAYFDEGIVFASSRVKSTLVNRKDSWTGDRFMSLYYAKGNETSFSNPVPFAESVQEKYNNGPVWFSRNRDEMYYTRNNSSDNNGGAKTKVHKLQIYSVKIKNGKYSEPVPFKYNSDRYSCTHPALSPDGTKLYFASDMPGTTGGMDIWVCTWNVNSWSSPVNLGPNINTAGNELFPTLTDDGQFYFSSNGLAGIGGLDIYTAVPGDNNFSKPHNLGAPINSSDDDFYYVMDRKTHTGYFSSNRSEHGRNDDIYSFRIRTVKINGIVTDLNTSAPLELSNVKIVEEFTPEENYKTSKDGVFEASLLLNKNYLIITEHPEYKPDTLRLTAEQVVAAGDQMNVNIHLEKEVVSIEGKIFSIATGKPIENAQLTIIDTEKHDTLFTVTRRDGSYSMLKLKPGTKYLIHAEADYCEYNTVDTVIVLSDNETPKINIGLYCLGETIVLKNILYDFDKCDIRLDAAKELDRVVELMKKYPHMKIELGSHTDCRGSYAYNTMLSMFRAKAAVAYISIQGIDQSRLIANGYGESRPVVKCDCANRHANSCSEEDHQLNRRTEIKILSLDYYAVKN